MDGLIMATNNLAPAPMNAFVQPTSRYPFLGGLAPQAGGSPLAKLYSYIDSMKRKGSAFTKDPLGEIAKGVQNFGEDNSKILDLQDTAYLSKSVLITPQERERARQELADYGAQVGLAGATVWQGSPHRFAPTAKNPLGEFDATKIGTGEGAQAYGYGHYLADAPEVATEYMNKLSGNVNARGAGYYPKINGQVVRDYFPDFDVIRKVAHETLPKPSGIMGRGGRDSISSDDAIKALVEKNNKILNDPIYFQSAKVQAKEENELLLKYIGKNIETSTPSLYKVDLPDKHIAKMLDWDKPLSQQPANVQAAINGPSGRTGEEIYNQFKIAAKFGFKSKPGDEVKFLRLMGIPGIRYLDGGSRAGGAGTSNYVVFPGGEDFLKILQRNEQTAAK